MQAPKSVFPSVRGPGKQDLVVNSQTSYLASDERNSRQDVRIQICVMALYLAASGIELISYARVPLLRASCHLSQMKLTLRKHGESRNR